MSRKGEDPNQLLLFEHRVPELLSVEEIFTRASEQLLGQLYEDRRIERKPPGIHAASLAEYLSMFANTPPEGGLVVVGIENAGRLTGCRSLSPSKLSNLERAGHTHCPDARCETRRVPVTNADGEPDFLLLFRIWHREDRVVETVKGNAYIRIGASKKRLKDSEKRELEISRGQVQLELEPCPSYRFPEDFDLALVQQFATSFMSSRGLEQGGRTSEEILELRHLGRREESGFIPNLACVLLFAKDPVLRVPGCKIRFLRFEGEREGTGEKFNAIKDIWLEGPVPRLIEAAEKVVEAQLRDFSRLDADGKFDITPEYPKLAWYEAVVNACAHRSYGLSNMNIFVKMFDDRLVIESPGGFPGIVTPQNIYEVHDPRNRFLMEAMFYLDFVKCAHEGTRRMRDTMREMDLPEPEFSEKERNYNLVRVTLRNSIDQRKIWIDSDASALVGEAIFGSLTDKERRAVNFVAENGTVNVSQVQRLTGSSWHWAKKLLMGLVDKGILEHRVRSDLDRDSKAHFVLRRSDSAR